jgi:hypothetical protein
MPCRLRRGSLHRRLLQCGQMKTSACLGTQRWQQRRHVNLGMRTLTMGKVYLKVMLFVEPSSTLFRWGLAGSPSIR